MSDKCSLTWKTFPEHLQFVFRDLYHDDRLTDVTLISDDQTQFKAHKVILSACSPFFKKIIESNPSQHPLIYLRGIESDEIESILQFMYLGEGRFYQDRMGEFFKVARDLQVKDIVVDIKMSDGFPAPVQNIQNINKDDNDSIPADEMVEEGTYEEQPDIRETLNQSAIFTPGADHENVKTSEISHEVNFKNINELHNVLEVDKESSGGYNSNNMDKGNLVEKEEESVEQETVIKEEKVNDMDERKYQCNECEYKARVLAHLKSHIQYKHEGVKYPCSECSHQATTKSSLKLHIKAIHDGVKYFCNQCEFKSSHPGNLHKHIKVKHTDIKYSCDQCDYQTSWKERVKFHIMTKHSSENSKKYLCHLCEYKSFRKNELNTHIKSKHESVKYPCNQCGKQFSHAASLQVHVQSIHEGQRFPCDQCGHQATQISNLKVHIKKYHESK